MTKEETRQRNLECARNVLPVIFDYGLLPTEEGLGHLLTDLHHFATAKNFDWNEALKTANDFYLEEQE
jgi:hypothetical protein